MAKDTTVNGKAYEYACLIALKEYLSGRTEGSVIVEDSDAYRTAQDSFNKVTQDIALNLTRAAKAAVRVILRLEPQLEYGKGDLSLAIQTDSQGQKGDVRDVVCIRGIKKGWEIGLSCKHNHSAVKHSRLSDTIDFGNRWFGIPCSSQYFDTVGPIFAELREMRDVAKANGDPVPQWKAILDKEERYYVPVLNAFLTEMQRLVANHPEVPGKLIQYLLGRHDFYKVISDDRRQTTRVEAINIAGTLNRSAGGHRSIVNVQKLILPNCIYHMGFVPGKNDTIVIGCDEGWTLTMRIHSASTDVEPSLKFDVELVSIPCTIHAQVEPW